MEAMQPGKTVSFTLIRGSSEKNVKVKLVKMPEDVFAVMLGQHMLAHAETKTASNK
jgi:hypothetical protein